MRALLLFSFYCFLALGVSAEDVPVSLEKALKDKLVSLKAYGNDNSPHYEKPLIVEIINLKKKPISILVENGRLFYAEDSTYQNLVITHEMIVHMNPEGKKKVELYAMCIESSDRAPAITAFYKQGPMADEKLAGLTKLIEQKKYHNTIGQYAVWAMACGGDVRDIAGFNNAQSLELQKFVCEKLNVPVPAPPAADDYKHNYNTTTYKREMGGFFEFNFSSSSNIHIAMFDVNGIVVRELYTNPSTPAGYHKIEFKFDSSVYNDDVYFVRLICDGKVLMERKVKTLQPGSQMRQTEE